MPPPPVLRLPLVAPLPAQQHRRPLLHGCRLHPSTVGNACQMLMHNNHCCCACISHDVQTLVLCNTQAVVDAVAALLSAGAFSPGQGAAEGGDTSGDAGASSSSGGGGRPAWALDFLARHLGDGRATAAPDTVMQVGARIMPAGMASCGAGQPPACTRPAPARKLRMMRGSTCGSPNQSRGSVFRCWDTWRAGPGCRAKPRRPQSSGSSASSTS